MLILRIQNGADRGTVFEVQGHRPETFGRVARHLELHDTRVSRRHARVRFRDGGWLINDLGSTHGTWLNDRRISEHTPLSVGDEIRIGRLRIVVERAEPPEAPARRGPSVQSGEAARIEGARPSRLESSPAMVAAGEIRTKATASSARRGSTPARPEHWKSHDAGAFKPEALTEMPDNRPVDGASEFRGPHDPPSSGSDPLHSPVSASDPAEQKANRIEAGRSVDPASAMEGPSEVPVESESADQPSSALDAPQDEAPPQPDQPALPMSATTGGGEAEEHRAAAPMAGMTANEPPATSATERPTGKAASASQSGDDSNRANRHETASSETEPASTAAHEPPARRGREGESAASLSPRPSATAEGAEPGDLSAVTRSDPPRQSAAAGQPVEGIGSPETDEIDDADDLDEFGSPEMVIERDNLDPLPPRSRSGSALRHEPGIDPIITNLSVIFPQKHGDDGNRDGDGDGSGSNGEGRSSGRTRGWLTALLGRS